MESGAALSRRYDCLSLPVRGAWPSAPETPGLAWQYRFKRESDHALLRLPAADPDSALDAHLEPVRVRLARLAGCSACARRLAWRGGAVSAVEALGAARRLVSRVGVFELLPISNLVPLPSLPVAPYRGAVAAIGAAALLGWIAAQGMAARRPLRFSGWRPAFGVALTVWYFALTCWGAGQFRDAPAWFGAVTKYDPGDIYARNNYVGALMNAGRHREARAACETLLIQIFGADGWLSTDKVTQGAEKDTRLYALLDDAQNDPKQIRYRLTDLYVLVGDASLAEKDAAGAQKMYQIACALTPNQADALIGLGRCALTMGRGDEALRWLRRATEIEPKYTPAHTALAYAYVTQKRWQEARTELKECVRLRPDIGFTYLYLAQVEWHLKNMEGVKAALTAGLATPIRSIAEKKLNALERGDALDLDNTN